MLVVRGPSLLGVIADRALNKLENGWTRGWQMENELTLFPRIIIWNLLRHSLDHAPILLLTDGAMSASPKSFCLKTC